MIVTPHFGHVLFKDASTFSRFIFSRAEHICVDILILAGTRLPRSDKTSVRYAHSRVQPFDRHVTPVIFYLSTNAAKLTAQG